MKKKSKLYKKALVEKLKDERKKHYSGTKKYKQLSSKISYLKRG